MGVIRAGGGVIVRQGETGAISVLVVHRPRYNDWTLPKGKADPGESDAECALREVEEETGLRCEIGHEVTRVEYRDQKNREKTVVYFLMRPIDGEFSVNDEVDEVRWLEPERATELLTYARDAAVVQRALRGTATA